MSAAQADVISYNAAISACEKASEWQASLATLFELLGWVKFLLWPVCVCVCVCVQGWGRCSWKLCCFYISCAICRPSWSVLSMITNSNLSPLKSKGTAKQWFHRVGFNWRSSPWGWRLQAGFCPTLWVSTLHWVPVMRQGLKVCVSIVDLWWIFWRHSLQSVNTWW